MFIDLSAVLSEQHKPIDEVVQLELDTIRVGQTSYPITEKEAVHIQVTHVKGSEYHIRGTSCIIVQIPCDRCLQDVAVSIPLDFSKQVDLGEETEQQDELDEKDYIDGYILDVDKLLYNEILIGWPTKTLCQEECKGICSVCGQNLNKGTCDCEDTSLDPRMSVIRDVFKNFKEV